MRLHRAKMEKRCRRRNDSLGRSAISIRIWRVLMVRLMRSLGSLSPSMNRLSKHCIRLWAANNLRYPTKNASTSKTAYTKLAKRPLIKAICSLQTSTNWAIFSFSSRVKASFPRNFSRKSKQPSKSLVTCACLSKWRKKVIMPRL